MIELKHVTKTFDTGRKKLTAVDDVSLQIQQGEIYGIIGYSGAGKSTLVRTLNGLEPITSGEVIIENKALSTFSRKNLRKERQKIGMIFQHFNLLWSRTVKENILFPLEIAGVAKYKRLKKAKELIQLVGLSGREDDYPSQLSGGQKQRVGIARALANDPKVLLCDEATSALDPKTTDDVLQLLMDINEKLNLTIVIITHEMEVIRKICHQVAVMSDGKIIEVGDTQTIFKNPKEEITRRFIREDEDESIEDLIQGFIQAYPEGKILRLSFKGQKAQEPIISKISRQFDVDINVIHGSIYSTHASAVGTLYVQLVGKEEQMAQTVSALKDLDVEVIHNGI